MLSDLNLGQFVHTPRASVTKQYTRNLGPVKGRWSPAAGKVTVGHASWTSAPLTLWRYTNLFIIFIIIIILLLKMTS